MTENTENNKAPENAPTELDLLKERASIMGITFHPNIGVEKLKNKLLEHQEVKEDPALELVDSTEPIIETEPKENAGQRRMRLRKDATQLIRCRITNMNPIKGNLRGEIISAGNSAIGFVKKYIPFGNEWHVPKIILTQLKNRKYLAHYTVKIDGKPVNRHRLVSEFAIEELPPLTAKQLKDLAQRQAMVAGKSE